MKLNGLMLQESHTQYRVYILFKMQTFFINQPLITSHSVFTLLNNVVEIIIIRKRRLITVIKIRTRNNCNLFKRSLT